MTRVSLACFLTLTLVTIAPSTAAPIQVSLVARDGLILAPAVITDDLGNTQQVYFQVDTGSSDTLIDQSLLLAGNWQTREDSSVLRTTDSNRTVARRVILPRIDIGPIAELNLKLPVVSNLIDITPVKDGLASIPVVGVLGADILFSRSCYLSLSKRLLTWTEVPPFPASESKELIWIPGGMWAVKGISLDGTESVFLIDTGTYDSFVPQETVESSMRQNPQQWVTWRNSTQEPFYASTATVVWRDPLATSARPQQISGLPSVVTSSLGTAALVPHDLWFKIDGFMMATLYLRNANDQEMSTFLSAVDLSVWGQEQQSWGFRVSPQSGEITWLGSFSNGRPIVPQLTFGDHLLSIDGNPWVPGGIQKLPSSLEEHEFFWVDMAGKTFSLRLAPKGRAAW